MNLFLLEIISKFLRMIFVAIISIFNLNTYVEHEVGLKNSITNNNTYAYNTVILKEDIVNKNVKKDTPVVNNTKKIEIKNNNVVNKIVVENKIEEKKAAIVENKSQVNTINPTNTLESYTGRLTGYGPDCIGCSSVGNVACLTKDRKKHSLNSDGIYYNDSQYGNVRILAAATTKFRCGTIIEVVKPGMQPFMAVVLDTGGDMRRAWNNGNVWMDLAYSSNSMAGSDNLTGKNITFNVQRWGW